MSATLAFDVYGTLIDTHGVVDLLKQFMGDKALSFSQTWRDKQLEYSFRRGLMQRYQHFGICTAQALDYTCLHHQIGLSADQKSLLLNQYQQLPVFDDVKPALRQLQADGHRLFAFSNGQKAVVEQLLVNSGIREWFIDIVSADDIQSFKPNPLVYQHFLDAANVKPSQAWLISSNPFDVLGALNVAMKSAWIQRSPQSIFDPWEQSPSVTLTQLTELSHKL